MRFDGRRCSGVAGLGWHGQGSGPGYYRAMKTRVEIIKACHGPTLVGRSTGPARPGPSFFHVVGRGLARPTSSLFFDGPRPGPAH